MKEITCIVLIVLGTTLTMRAQQTEVQKVKRDSLASKPKKGVTPSSAKSTPGRKGSTIVDDSTKNVYGPKTSLWTTERDVFLDRENYRPVDTTLSNYHRWTFWQKLNYFYQDLGNNGTALNPIFPTHQSETVGADPGFYGFQKLYSDAAPVYYNTKSPYTRMYLVWGGQGRATTRAEYSRNVNSRWNVGFNYRPIITLKQIQKRGKNDFQVVSHYYDFYTHYKSKDSTYSLMASYRRIRTKVVEHGGVVPLFASGVDAGSLSFDESYTGYFQKNASPRLKNANSSEQRNQVHLFQQYRLHDKLQVYHTGELSRQMNWFRDDLSADGSYFDSRFLDEEATKVVDSTRFSFVQNQLGLKGRALGDRLFFNGYYKVKSYNWYNQNLRGDTLAFRLKADEYYSGGELLYDIDSLQHVDAQVEFLAGGYQRIHISGDTKYGEFDIQKRVSKPSFLATAYSGHVDFWNNRFDPVEMLVARAFPKVTIGQSSFWLGATYTNINRFVYFVQRDTFPGTTQRVLPVQAANPVTWVTPELRADITLPGFVHLRPQVLYSSVLADKDSALTIPKLFANVQIAMERMLFKNNLQIQAGLDLHWHSSYQAMGYDPSIQTYYVQHKVSPPSYLLADVFFNGKVKRGRFFFKWHNFLQTFHVLHGHMPTPYYRGMRNVIDFGFDIFMFD